MARSCSACGGPLPPNAPQGLCPLCLFQLGSDLPFDGARGGATVASPNVAPAGRRLGDYELVGEVARGGMGVVWRARQASLNRTVALKLIAAGELASAEAVQRFRAEAEAAASLDHPNIVPIYEIGEWEGQHYFSMKLIEGRSLAERISTLKFQISSCEAAALLAKVARAVHYAHQHGILHRDLKPGNILLDAAGAPHVTDFGLAKRVEGGSDLTLSGAVLGTPAYMAPEQARGGTKRLTTAADIYSLGAMLYEVMTGRPPFTGATPLEVMRRAVDEPPKRPSAMGLRIDRDLETVFLKCLEKDPQRRYASAEALAQDLERWLRHEPILARPSTTAQRVLKWARRKPALAAAVLALHFVALVGLAGILWQWRQAVVARNSARLAQGTAEQASGELKQTLARARVSEGWRRVEEGDFFGGLADFTEAMRLEQDDPQREPMHRLRLAAVLRQCPKLALVWSAGGPITHVALSPDRTRLATACRAEIEGGHAFAQVWDAETGRAVTPPLEHTGTVNMVEFSPDGSRVITASMDTTARLWDATTGQPITPPLSHPRPVWQARFSPDGQRVVTCASGRSRSDLGVTTVWDAMTGRVIWQAGDTNLPVHHVRFSPDGQSLVEGSDGYLGHLLDAKTGLLLAPLPADSPKCWRMIDSQFSSDGTLVLVLGAFGRHAEERGARVVRARDGLGVSPILRHAQGVGLSEAVAGAFSADNSRVTTASKDHTARVWLASSGEPLTPALAHRNEVVSVAFSPDDRRLATASLDLTARVWDAETGEPVTPNLPHGAPLVTAQFSADGGQLITASQDGLVYVWDLRVPGGAEWTLVHSNAVWCARFSPTGQQALVGALEDHLFVVDVQTRAEPPALLKTGGPAAEILFSADARYFLTSAYCAQLWQVTTREQCGRFEAENFRFAEVSRDGRRVVVLGKSVQVWDVNTSQAVASLDDEAKGQGTVTFTPDGQCIVLSGPAGTVQVREALGGALRQELPLHRETVLFIRYSPDGRLVVTGSADHTAAVWDATTWRRITPPLTHRGRIAKADFSFDSRRVLTGSEDGTARVWDAASGEPVTPWLRHGLRLRDVAFNREGRLVVTASDDGTARVWDAVTGEPITPPLRHANRVYQASFSPDSQWVLTASEDRTARLWPLPTLTAPLSDLQRFARLFTGAGEVAARAQGRRAAFLQEWAELKERQPAAFAVTAADVSAWNRQPVIDLHVQLPGLADETERRGEWSAAIRHLSRLIQAAPDQGKYHGRRARAYQHWSEASRQTARAELTEHALADFRRAAELIPGDDGLMGELLRLLSEQPDQEEYVHYAERHLAFKPGDAFLRVALAKTFLLGSASVRNSEQALALARRALQILPDLAEAREALGLAYYRSGEWSKAAQELEDLATSGVAGQPSLLTLLTLAMSHHQLGRVEEARQHYEKALASRLAGNRPDANLERLLREADLLFGKAR